MAIVRDERLLTRGDLVEVFNRLKANGFDYMVVASQNLEDEYAITFGQKVRGIRKDHAEEDLRDLFADVGTIRIQDVYVLGADFNSSAKGGVELLPVHAVVKISEENALADYRAKLQRMSFLDRVAGNFPSIK